MGRGNNNGEAVWRPSTTFYIDSGCASCESSALKEKKRKRGEGCLLYHKAVHENEGLLKTNKFHYLRSLLTEPAMTAKEGCRQRKLATTMPPRYCWEDLATKKEFSKKIWPNWHFFPALFHRRTYLHGRPHSLVKHMLRRQMNADNYTLADIEELCGSLWK